VLDDLNKMEERKVSIGKGMLERVAKRLPRAGLLLLPHIGEAAKEIIYGVLDEKISEENFQQIIKAIKDLETDIHFAQADLKDQIAIVAENLMESNEELGRRIENLNPLRIENLNPLRIENLVIQVTKPIVIQVINIIPPEEINALASTVGVFPPDVSGGKASVQIGELLFDKAKEQGSLTDLVSHISNRYPARWKRKSRINSEVNIDGVKAELLRASRSLLAWPKTLGKDRWLERKELDVLLERCKEEKISTTIILGKPGTGKSALLAELTQRLCNMGTTVLAIKADMLPKSVKDAKGLQDYLKLSYQIETCLECCGEHEPTVLIVDQLDALSERVDRDSERLNVLLNLIHTASKIEGLQVVTSSREFEYRHDVRLNTLEAELVELQPLSWDQALEAIREAGFSDVYWSEEAQKLLCVPWHLKLFLELKMRNPATPLPTSIQGLMEAIWTQKVVGGHQATTKTSLVDRLAARMAKNEELWVSRALADDCPEALNHLVQENILIFDDSGLRIGFSHQTFFDFALARAFARGQAKLSQYIFERQDGLFVRPILLRGLEYLKGSSPAVYHRELTALWNYENLRIHLRNLLIEYLGSLEWPDETEVACLRPMLEDESCRFKVLMAMASSPGWFNLIKTTCLPQLMSQGADLAHYPLWVLTDAIRFAKNEVLELVKKYWLSSTACDEHTLRLLTYLTDWDEDSVDLVCILAKRHQSFSVGRIADLVSQSQPDLAPKIVRADFDRRLIEMAEKKKESWDDLLRGDKEWYELDEIAIGAPCSFLKAMWPWYLSIVERVARNSHSFIDEYQDDYTLGTIPDRSLNFNDQPVCSLKDAIVSLAKASPNEFLKFFNENKEKTYMAVHRLLCPGLAIVAPSNPEVVLAYLTADSKRLMVGDSFNRHRESLQLISAVFPHLDQTGRLTLENAVVEWSKYKRLPEAALQERFDRKKWDREHRLRLLRAFPENLLSEKTRALRAQEERALPGVEEDDARMTEPTLVGSRMSQEQMSKARDENILNLFDELEDETGWHHPRFDLVGGSIQSSREIGQLAEKEPERMAELVLQFKPGRQERPTGAVIEGLSKSELPSDRLFNLVRKLVEKGFSSHDFRRDVADGLNNRAKRDKGLPDDMIELLKNWLPEDPEPEPTTKEEDDEITGSLLWGFGIFTSLPGGRGKFIETIAAGYLRREPPDYKSWAEVVEKLLLDEQHTDIWQITLQEMALLFNWDASKAAEYFDQILSNFPEVRESRLGVLAIGRVLPLIPEQKILEKWLVLLRDGGWSFSQQAYGELLMLRRLQKPDDFWAEEQVAQVLNDLTKVGIHRGIAYAAAYKWPAISWQDTCTSALVKLAPSQDEVVQKAISVVFRFGEQVPLNDNMKQVIEAILPHDRVLLKCVSALVEGIAGQTAVEPELVGRISHRVLDASESLPKGETSNLFLVAENLVSIALTLHRMPQPHRETGLVLFERLIENQIGEAKAALSLLDRKLVAVTPPPRPRRRRRQA